MLLVKGIRVYWIYSCLIFFIFVFLVYLFTNVKRLLRTFDLFNILYKIIIVSELCPISSVDLSWTKIDPSIVVSLHLSD